MIDGYTLTPEEFQRVKNYAQSYSRWKKTYSLMLHSLKSQSLGTIRSGGEGKPTEDLALRRSALGKKISLVEDSAREADPQNYKYLLLGVTSASGVVTFKKLRQMGMICGKNTWSKQKRRFYWILSRKLKMIDRQKSQNHTDNTVNDAQSAD